jgi:TetR/AcrR family transcriptional regulator
LAASERRRQLLDTALDLFSRKGFEGTTTKEIATSAGVTEAIIFRHFPSKHALYTAVIDDHHASSQYAECVAEWKACMDRNDDEGLVRSIVGRIIESHRCDARMHRLLLFAALEGHETGLAHNRQIVAPIAEMFFRYVKRRQSEGAMLACDPGSIIAAVVGTAKHYGMMTEMFGFQTTVKIDQVVDDFVRILIGGFKANFKAKKNVKGKK